MPTALALFRTISRRGAAFRALFGLSAVVLSACSSASGSPTDARTSTAESTPHGHPNLHDEHAVRLEMTMGAMSQELTVSRAGTTTTLFAADGTKSALVVFDYDDGSALLASYPDKTYTPTTVNELVDSTLATRAAFAGAVAPPSGTLRKTPHVEQIAGLPARMYLATVNGVETRLFYAESLPLPPDRIRAELAALDQIAAHDGDNDHGGDDDHVTAGDVAGRTVLRSQTLGKDGTWTTTVDTRAASFVRLGPDGFTIPDGFSQVPLPPPPGQVQPAFDSAACYPNGSPVAVVVPSGGPVLHDLRVYLNFVGPSLASVNAADPAGFSTVFLGAVQQAASAGYLSGLGQYGLRTSAIVKTRVIGGAALPSKDFITDAAYVEALMINGDAPLFWWKTGGADPLVVLVEDDQENTSTPYHLAAPSPTWLLPFPVNFFANDFIPYALATIPHAGVSVTAAQLANRDTPSCGGDCNALYSLDQGTINVSHEMVEAVSDPYPFSGWWAPEFFPPWNDGEIADICDLQCTNGPVLQRMTRAGNAVLSTYWSNAAADCVGPWRPSIHIDAPGSGDVAWRAGGPLVNASASIGDVVTQGARAAQSIAWTVDGATVDFGSPVQIRFSSLGPHTLAATITDPESSASASDQVVVNVVDVAASLSLDSPNDGATLVQGAGFVMSGSATNLDYPSGVPGTQLHWFVDGAAAGTGTSVVGPALAIGDHTVTLSFTDSAGVVQSVTHTVHVVPAGSLPFTKLIAANNSHTCGLLPDGTAKCWGNDSWGELGDGQNLVSHVTPVSAVGFSGGVSIAAGEASTCALLYDGTARCWGDNPAGELGDGTTTERDTPVAVVGLTGATSITMGDHHACAVVAGGAVQCWGNNSNGQLGDGTQTSRSTPVTVAGLSGVKQLVAGGWWTCGLLSGGTVACWGDQFYSPASFTDGIHYGVAPVAVAGLSNVASLSAGPYHACAVLSDSTVSCWGGNVWGQLGDGTTTNRATPQAVPGLSGVTAVATGGAHTCVVLSDSTVRCWGDGMEGQLGGGGGAVGQQTTPTSVVGLSGVAQLAAGSEYTCALLTSGGASCWGSNYDGQLGNASVSSTDLFGTSTPVPVIGWP